MKRKVRVLMALTVKWNCDCFARWTPNDEFYAVLVWLISAGIDKYRRWMLCQLSEFTHFIRLGSISLNQMPMVTRLFINCKYADMMSTPNNRRKTKWQDVGSLYDMINDLINLISSLIDWITCLSNSWSMNTWVFRSEIVRTYSFKS